MNLTQIIRMARTGRPDLAAKNLGATGCGAWQRPVRLIRVLARYPHSSGQRFSIRYLATCWREGRSERDAG